MSVLTKLFVVLMIVCALLLTGAVVVFVNRSDDYREALRQKKSELDRAREEVKTATENEKTARNRELDQARTGNQKISELGTELQKLNQALAAAGVDKTQLQGQLATSTAQNTAQAEALKAINQNLKDVQTRYDAIVKDNDELRNRNTELASTNTDYLKRLDEAERERRWLNEQVVQLKSEVDRVRRVLADKGVDADVATIKRAPADIVGTVKSVKSQNDQNFAVISLGSADHITKGTELVVVNPNNTQFLAKLTVISVEPNESFGELKGPYKNDVQKDCKVISQ